MKWIKCSLCLFLSIFFHTVLANGSTYLVGQGIADITGPPVDVGMMGYASLFQKTSGIHTRLWSRAFVIEDEESRRIVFVSADLGMIFQAVKREVVKRLQTTRDELYTDANVMLTATHTHCGPGGHSEHSLYNTGIGGFDKLGFERIVAGIVRSIEMAEENMQPAEIFLAAGSLMDASVNRSLPAYLQNPQTERDQYLYPFDDEMLLIRFDAEEDLGLINWFGVHPTSLGKQVTWISSDNKGLAALKFEARMNAGRVGPFVAAFAQGLAGDVSPNNFGPKKSFGKLPDDFNALEISASKQWHKAIDLFVLALAEERLKVTIQYKHAFIKFSDLPVAGQWTDGQDKKTCNPKLGLSFTAGAEDGPSNLPFIKEGMVADPVEECQQEKRTVPVELGENGSLTTPEILPIQIFVIDQLAIVGLPFEVTTMAGRRIKRQMAEELKVKHVVVSTLANAYSGYLTTREEYAVQHYEGASNHFGPWSLAAVQQELHKLASSNSRSILEPTDLSDTLKPFTWPKAASTQTAALLLDVVKNHVYRGGETVEVKFSAGYPNWSLNLLKSFVEIHQVRDRVVIYDWDPNVIFDWKRSSKDPIATVFWKIPNRIAPGQYFILHKGHLRDERGDLVPYQVKSSVFEVRS